MNVRQGFSVVIPAYNEAASIVSTITGIQKLPGEFEIIVVDDGSADGTYELAAETGAKVLKHMDNRGYGAALKTGIRHAKYDLIIITDADGTYPNEKIPFMLESITDETDMTVAARTNKNAKIPLIRRPAKWLITKLACFLASTNIPDLNSGLRIMKKSVLEKYIHLLPDGFSFTSTITLAMLTNGYIVDYVPIDYFKRVGKSKIRPIHDTLTFVQLIIRMALYFDPLKVFLPISLPLLLFGFLLMLYQAIVLHDISTIAVIISLGGVQLLAIGMIADLIDKRVCD